MKKYILFIVLIIALQYSYAQSFEYHSDAPFNIELINYQDTSNSALLYLFEDADQDGDVDLTLAGMGEQDTTSANPLLNLRFFMEYQENTGNKTSPMFAQREKPYDKFQYPTGAGFMIPDGGDLNNDGLIDFVVSAEIDIYDIQYLQFQIQNPDGSFTVTNCEDWNLDPFPAYSFYVPHLTDLDMDGDLDLLLVGYYNEYDEDFDAIEIPSILYAKNIGSPENAIFKGWYENPYGLGLAGKEQSILTSGDFDLDGDIDIIGNGVIDDSISVFYYSENIGTSKPEFADPILSPFGLPVGNGSENFLFTSLVDIDGDGDLDLFLPVLGDDGFEFRYYENGMLSDIENLIDDNSVILFPNPTDRIVHINNLSNQPLISLEIYNTEGKLLFTSNSGDLNQIDFLRYDAGVYFVKMNFENSKLMKKVILMK